jgi:hypothetical protein
MLTRNRDFEAVARRLDDTIARLEAAAEDGRDRAAADAWLNHLVRRRQAIGRLLLNRRLEASRHVVDFLRWFEADGALYEAGAISELMFRPAAE